jgi:catechol 2,3-dioxygenase-like lactoylglutathione lyase family enzyme
MRNGVYVAGHATVHVAAIPEIVGAHHAAFTVSDVERSSAWYCDLLGFEQVMSGDDKDCQRPRPCPPSIRMVDRLAPVPLQAEQQLRRVPDRARPLLTSAAAFADALLAASFDGPTASEGEVEGVADTQQSTSA